MHGEQAHGLGAAHGSWLHFAYRLGLPERIAEPVVNTWLIIILLALGSYLATRRLDLLPHSVQNLLEWLLEQMEAFTTQIMGPQGKTFVPLIGTLFLYIFVMNAFGLIPGFLSPTANLNTTLALAICVFAATQYQGLRSQGLLGYLKHLWGQPWYLGPLMLPIHLIEEFLARPLSLAIRLFGNVFGEDTVIAQLGGMVVVSALVGLLSFMTIGLFSLLLQTAIIAFALFTSLVQALIFAALASVYIAGATEAHD